MLFLVLSGRHRGEEQQLQLRHFYKLLLARPLQAVPVRSERAGRR